MIPSVYYSPVPSFVSYFGHFVDFLASGPRLVTDWIPSYAGHEFVGNESVGLASHGPKNVHNNTIGTGTVNVIFMTSFHP